MKVRQFLNERGIPVRNQFILEEKGQGWNGNFIIRTTFQSYDSIIATITRWDDRTDTVLDVNFWDYSVTTGKYRNQFLREDKRETERKIKSGAYKLEDLNKGE